MEVGSIILFSGITLPNGYLVCDGSEVDRDQYASLFEVIGTTYGAGNGTTTFNLPNLNDSLPIGVSQSYVLGTEYGENEHTLLAAELPSHSHTAPAHSHGNDIAASVSSMSHTVTQAVFKFTRLNGSTGITTGRNGGRYTGYGTAAMTRSTNLAVSNHPATACTMSGGVMDCPAFDTESAGLSTPHNNMMPYVSLTYLIYAPETVYEPGMAFYNGCLPVGPSGCYIVGKG